MWRNGYFRLFISHLARKRRFAGEIQQELLKFGVSSFVAHKDIAPTKEWQNEIESALKTCDGMLALLHPGFHESDWTDQEIGYAMGRQLFIVTISFGIDPYGFIGRFQAMEGNHKSTKDLTTELFDILRQHQQTRERISKSVVEYFSQSNSFQCAKKNMELLERLDYWDPSLSTRVRSAANSNGQIRDAWGVPERLKEFIERMERSHSL